MLTTTFSHHIAAAITSMIVIPVGTFMWEHYAYKEDTKPVYTYTYTQYKQTELLCIVDPVPVVIEME
jgi:hypothetical protein